MFEIARREAREISSIKGWLLLYGRRKVGKTFLLRKSVRPQAYILVTKVGNAIVEENEKSVEMSIDEAMNRVEALAKEGGCVIIDEFQRLRKGEWDRISLLHPDGRIIASGSSNRLVEDVFSKKSQLLGFFSPMHLDIASYADAVTSLKQAGMGSKDALVWGAVVRDPWIIPMVDLEMDASSEIAKKAKYMVMSVNGLVGEIFEEEDRALTAVYDSILRLVGSGMWKPAEIANVLSSNGMIGGGVATVIGVMSRLSDMGLIRKIPLWKTKGSRFYYRSSSPIVSMLYYLDQKYSISEQNYTVDDRIVNMLMGKELQFCIGSLMAQSLSGRESYTVLEGGEGDIDIVVLDKRGKNAIKGYEVKMGPISRKEAAIAVDRMHRHGINNTGLISIRERPEAPDGSTELIGPEDLVRIAGSLSGK